MFISQRNKHAANASVSSAVVDVVLVDLNTYKDLTTFCYSCVL